MKDWFDSLQSRERQFVLIGTVVVIVALIYGLVWAPLVKKEQQLYADIATWERSIEQLRPLRALVASSGQSGSIAPSGYQESPLIVVDQTLLGRGLDRYRNSSQPTSSNGIRVVFEGVAFDELMLWLGDLSEQHSMHVENASFSAGSRGVSGRVNATLTLERAP